MKDRSFKFEDVDRIFARAVELKAEARAEYLREACKGDGDLRREVASLLEFDELEEIPTVELASKRFKGPLKLVFAEECPPLVIGPDRPQATIGRGAQSTRMLYSASVSRSHARVWWHEGSVRIADLGSRNGVRLNGRYIEEEFLAPGDTLQIGSVFVEVVAVEDA